jgi:hypothetical protein
MDAFTAHSFVGERARRTAVRDRHFNLVSPRQLTGHMPDPRVAPAAKRFSSFGLVTVLQLIACAAPVVIAWVVLA